METEGRVSYQRLKILYLYKILIEKTDENHPLTLQEIIRELNLCGISAARKALYEDMEALRSFGVDIITTKGNNASYYVATRDFQLPELKLLADAVASSRFLTAKKSQELLKKIGGLTSVHQSKELQRQIFVADRVKAMNEKIYISMDEIRRAISEKKQISFRYFGYDLQKKKCFRDEERVASPYALTWDDDRYYLVAFYEKYPESLTNFRVDRMEQVTVIDKPTVKLPEDFRLSDYLNSTFSMFSGADETVKLRFHNSLVNTVIDRFGKGVALIPDDEEHFTVRVNAKVQQTFFGWLFSFGNKAQLLEPEHLRQQYKQQLKAVLADME